MGYARKNGSGASRWTNWLNARDRAARNPGTPVPGTGGHHSRRKGHGGGNRIGAITRPNGEYGSRARKQEEHQTGIAKRAEEDSIEEYLDEMADAAHDKWDMWLMEEVDHPDTPSDWPFEESFYDAVVDDDWS